MTQISWPNGKKFAFTIIDDTDNATVQNIKPIYEFLDTLGFLTTKTIWVYPSRDHFYGYTLQDKEYVDFLNWLLTEGFEIASHGVGSGKFTREEIIQGFDEFKNKLNFMPSMHVNHARNIDNLYWGKERFQLILKSLLTLKNNQKFYGTDKDSNHFWGDIAKNEFKYIRNHTFNGINTLKYDPQMPYKDKNKVQYSNYWFSSSDGHTIEEFNGIVNKKNIDKLEKEGGACIMYTHFASGFLDNTGSIDPQFKKSMSYLAQKNGWFVPASKLLDFLQSQHKTEYASSLYLNLLDIRWLINRIIKKVKYKR